MMRVINVSKNLAYPAAVRELKRRLRQCKYLNNIVEQDDRALKKRVWLAKSFESFLSSWLTLKGIETIHMIQKGKIRWLAKKNVRGQAKFVVGLFGTPA